MKTGALVGRGRTADVYVIDGDEHRIVKLYHSGISIAAVEWERSLSELVSRSGLDVPRVYDIIDLDGRHGLVYDRIHGKPMLQSMLERPWRVRTYARTLATLHSAVHAVSGAGMPSQRDRFVRAVQRTEGAKQAWREQAHQLLEKLPDGTSLCHNDFHPENVLMTSKGPIIIDWIDASQGNPLADVARTSLMLEIALPPHASWLDRHLLNWMRQQFRKVYDKNVVSLSHGDLRQLQAWRFLVAFMRLSENIPDESASLSRILDTSSATF